MGFWRKRLAAAVELARAEAWAREVAGDGR
jgi:hypothetical protein